MFGLVVLFWMGGLSIGLLIAIVPYRSAYRHKKRAKVYRKQIEELQIERAKVMAEYEGLYKFQSIIKQK